VAPHPAGKERLVFKFVASSVTDLDRTAELVDAHRLAPMRAMPEGTTADAITATTWVLTCWPSRTREASLISRAPLPSPSPWKREKMTSSVASSEPDLIAVPVTGRSTGVIDTDRVASLIAQLLTALGEDPAREGLTGTPDRVAAWWSAFLSPDDAAMATSFTESQLSDQLVIVSGMSVWSLCEHHMLPMSLQVTAGYLPEGEVVGLSKFGRIAQHLAGRLQVQERFTRQVAEHLADVIGREDIAVAVRGVHLCMSMRGVRMETARTTTVHTGGRFAINPVLNQQFVTLATAQWNAA
jgi:GTP cyclohydrolase I